jgi:hypothetical protein
MVSRRPFLKKSEVEESCLAALSSANLLPQTPTAIRIDRLIEKTFKVSPEYEDLPSGILGFTKFDACGPVQVVINKCLDNTDDLVSQRRLRTTLAHEFGHMLFHGNLFAIPPVEQLSIFASPPEPQILCRDDSNLSQNDWREYQANMAIGPLLLPRTLVEMALVSFLKPKNFVGTQQLINRRQAEILLADQFDVNPIVAALRLEDLYPPTGGQLLMKH